MDFNPYEPPKLESDAIELFRLESPDVIRGTYAQLEADLGTCFLIYVAVGILIAVPATVGISGGIYVFASPRMLKDAGFFPTLGILAAGLGLAGLSLLYAWTGWGIANGLRSAHGLGFALILPLLFLPPVGTIAGWLLLKTLTSEGTRVITSKEYHEIQRVTVFPKVRVPWLLILVQISAVVQIVVMLSMLF